MTIEQRMDQLEKRNKHLTVALTMIANKLLTAALPYWLELPSRACWL